VLQLLASTAMPLLKLQVPCFRILQVAALIGQGELRAYISKGQIAKIETRPTKQGRAPEGALELRDATRLKTGTRCKRTLRKIERNLEPRYNPSIRSADLAKSN